jgi:hydroxymethylpyrimidine pyrophosphatase-like HAD family hydrolase
MKKEGIIFADIDGTLIFHEEIHNIQILNKSNDGLVRVFDSLTKKEYLTQNVSTNLYNIFLDVETKKLAQKLRDRFYFVFVSAARKSTMDLRKEVMNFADAYVLESGGLILRGDYSPDDEWSKRFVSEKPHLDVMRQQLQDKGWILDIEGRTLALRVRKKDNPKKSDSDFEDLCTNIELPAQLRKTMNIGNLDVFVASAGKGNGVDHVISMLGFDKSQTIGIGDDINDIEMLNHTGKKYVLGSSYQGLLDIAQDKKWYISKGLHFDGINEILMAIDKNSKV